jgi:DNA processing protein
MNNSNTTEALLAVSRLEGMSRQRFAQFVRRLKRQDLPENQHLTYMDLIDFGMRVNLFSPMLPISFFMAGYQSAQQILERCSKAAIHMTSPFDERFPTCFQTSDGPALLFYRGALRCLGQRRMAVIGTRTPSANGKIFAYDMGCELAKRDNCVISGLAKGCDAAAHLGCLENGGKTVAFLPASLTGVVPSSNRELANEIVNGGGCLISEYSPLEETPRKHYYVARDRLQAMSAQAIIVSEFDENSGTMHTLRFAEKYKRPIITDRAIAASSPETEDALSKLQTDVHILAMAEIKIFLNNMRKN